MTCAAFAVLVALIGAIACGGKDPAPAPEVVRPVKLLTLEGGEEGFQREFPGRVQAAMRVDLAFQVSGPLVRLDIDEGQEVRKGQTLARIRPRDFETRLVQARAQALEAEQQYNRYKELYVRNQASKAEFDRYKSQYDVAQAREKDARDALDDTNLRAPFSGIVGTVYVENHEDVTAKQPIASLQDLSGLDILINVPEALMAKGNRDLKVEASATFAADRERKFHITLKEFTTEADPQTQTYRVTFRLDPPADLAILPGMTATVHVSRVLGEDPEGRIKIPALAVVSDGAGTPFVWVVDTDAMTVHKRPVTTGGPTGTDEIEILEGLKPGETLAVSAVSRLSEGLKIRELDR